MFAHLLLTDISKQLTLSALLNHDKLNEQQSTKVANQHLFNTIACTLD